MVRMLVLYVYLFSITLLFVFLFVCSLFFCYFFFFSSRSRHTRCLSDWSSDVCSSDLESRIRGDRLFERANRLRRPAIGELQQSQVAPRRGRARRMRENLVEQTACAVEAPLRSEERRVGKGGKATRPPDSRHKHKALSD